MEEKIKSVSDVSFEVNHSKNLQQDDTNLIDKYSNELLLFNTLYSDYSSTITKAISLSERSSLNLSHDSSFVYGEVEFLTLLKLINKLTDKYGLVVSDCIFVDLGSGSGKACYLASLLFKFKVSIGIEMLESLHNIATVLQQKYKVLCGVGNIQFINKDICATDEWLVGKVIFIHSTCFSQDLMKKISKKCTKLDKGAFVISFTWSLDNENFKILEQTQYQMSWGISSVIIQQRL